MNLIGVTNVLYPHITLFEFVRVGLVVRLLRRVKDVLPNWGFPPIFL